MESVFLQFEVKAVFYYVVAAGVLHAELFLKFLAVSVVLGRGLVYRLHHLVALGGALLQLARHLDAYLVGAAVFGDCRVDDVYHLVQYLLDNGVAQRAPRQFFQLVLQLLAFYLVFGKRARRMAVAGVLARRAVFQPVFHVRQYPAHGFRAKAAVVRL